MAGGGDRRATALGKREREREVREERREEEEDRKGANLIGALL
jgi:hypothetical protein